MPPASTAGNAGALEIRRALVGGIVHDLQHRAVIAEFPAVIDAADAAILDPAQRERGAAMHAELVEHANLALAVAEHDEILAEQALGQRRAAGRGQAVGRADRQPETAEQRAHRRAGPDPAQAVVLFARHHRLFSP